MFNKAIHAHASLDTETITFPSSSSSSSSAPTLVLSSGVSSGSSSNFYDTFPVLQLRNVDSEEINLVILAVLATYAVLAFFPAVGVAVRRRVSGELSFLGFLVCYG